MNKKMIIQIIGIVVILIGLALVVYSARMKSAANSEVRVIGVNEAISSDGSFSFSLPDFKSWQYIMVNIQYIKSPTPEELARSTFEYTPEPGMVWSGQTPKITANKIWKARKSLLGYPNPNHIAYAKDNLGGLLGYKIIFQDSVSEVEVIVSSGNAPGFPTDAVVDEIVKTFRFIPISQEVALQVVVSDLKNRYGDTYDFSRFDISGRLENDGWHVIYENKTPEPGVNGGIKSGFTYLIDSNDGKILSEGPIVINPSNAVENKSNSLSVFNIARAFAESVAQKDLKSNYLIEVTSTSSDWTHFRAVYNQDMMIWRENTTVKLAISSDGTETGWSVASHKAGQDKPLPVLVGKTTSVATDDDKAKKAEDLVWQHIVTTTTALSGAKAAARVREALKLVPIDATCDTAGQCIRTYKVWGYYTPLNVSIDQATGEIIGWRVNVWSEDPSGSRIDEAAAIKSASPELKNSHGAQGPKVTFEKDSGLPEYVLVYWWHTENGINVEGDQATVFVNVMTGKVSAVSRLWRAISPEVLKSPTINEKEALAIADQKQGAHGSVAGLKIIQIADNGDNGDKPGPVHDALVWDVNYSTDGGIGLVVLRVDAHSGKIVGMTGW